MPLEGEPSKQNQFGKPFLTDTLNPVNRQTIYKEKFYAHKVIHIVLDEPPKGFLRFRIGAHLTLPSLGAVIKKAAMTKFCRWKFTKYGMVITKFSSVFSHPVYFNEPLRN